MNLYPNPAHDILFIKLGEIALAGEVFVYDVAGRQINVPVNSGRAGIILNTANLAQGTYTVVYHTTAGNQAGIFVKQ